jgi:hypothetical protein
MMAIDIDKTACFSINNFEINSGKVYNLDFCGKMGSNLN